MKTPFVLGCYYKKRVKINARNKTDNDGKYQGKQGKMNSSLPQKENKHAERSENIKNDNNKVTIKDSSNKGKGPAGENL